VRNISTLQRKKEFLLDATEFCVEIINTEKNKYVVMSSHQNAKKKFNTKVANESFERVKCSSSGNDNNKLKLHSKLN
jgi:hypothetical protein